MGQKWLKGRKERWSFQEFWCLCFALSNTSLQCPCTLDLCVFLLYARKVQCGMKLNPKTLITLNTCMYANRTVLCMCVSACMCAVLFPCELWWFCTAVFTDSFFFSPAPHPLEWFSLPPTQSLTQRAMFPSQFPMGYDSYSVEQQQGVYVCECVCVVRGDVGVWYPWHGNVKAM